MQQGEGPPGVRVAVADPAGSAVVHVDTAQFLRAQVVPQLHLTAARPRRHAWGPTTTPSQPAASVVAGVVVAACSCPRLYALGVSRCMHLYIETCALHGLKRLRVGKLVVVVAVCYVWESWSLLLPFVTCGKVGCCCCRLLRVGKLVVVVAVCYVWESWSLLLPFAVH